MFTVLFIFTALLYAPSLPGEFYFDDGFLLDNPVVTDLKNIPKFFQGDQLISPMRGISTLSFAINYQLSGWSPLPFRLVNIVLHFLNGCLVWMLTGLLLEKVRRREENDGSDIDKTIRPMPSSRWEKVIPVFTAALFISHPVLTSGVSYIFQRNGLLSTVFYLSATVFLLKAFTQPDAPQRRYLFLSAFSYLLSTWSKEIGITFIAIIFIFEWLLQEKRNLWKRFWDFLPHLLVCAFSLFMTYTQMVRQPIRTREMYGDWGGWANVMTQWNIIVQYMKRMVWPHPGLLSIDHDFSIIQFISDPRAWLSGLLILGLILTGILIRQRQPLMAFGIFWFFITLSPTSSVIPIREVFVEYRLYLPAFGFLLACVLGLRLLFQKIPYPTPWAVAGIFLLILCSAFTLQRNRILGSEFLVWQDAARKGPQNIRANTVYGTLLLKQGNKKDALRIFKKTARLNEMNLPFKTPTATPHNELGVFLAEKGDTDGAKKQYINAMKADPWYRPARDNLSFLLEQTPEEQYLDEYEKVFRQVDFFPQGHYYVGSFYLRKKDYANAINELEKAIEQQPGFYQAYNNLGVAFVNRGQTEKARQMFEKTLNLKPDYQPAKENLKALQ